MSLYTGIIMLTELLISHLRKLGDAWKEMGCAIHSPFMTMAYISLACVPELRLTNRGLVDCRTFRSADLFPHLHHSFEKGICLTIKDGFPKMKL